MCQIVRGVMAPGARVVEQEIAERMGVGAARRNLPPLRPMIPPMERVQRPIAGGHRLPRLHRPGGMRQRFGIAVALIGDPRLIGAPG